MKCPKCGNLVDLRKDISNENCPHCGFYHYIQHALRITAIASRLVDHNEDFYFGNIHQRIYNPYISLNEGRVEPIDGALKLRGYLLEQIKTLIKSYPREDLYFIMLAMRELATWKIILQSEDSWASVQVRNISHLFTNILSTLEEDDFGIDGIIDETDFISLFVFTEEIEKISSNILGTKIFSWKPTLEEIIKIRIENERLNEYYQHFEVQELVKPEEIEINDEKINKFLTQRGIEINRVKKSVSKEIERLAGFSFKELKEFRNDIITIAKESGQVFDIFPLNENKSIQAVFIFDDQLKDVINKERENIISYLTYGPSNEEEYILNYLTDPYMDFKFIFRYEGLLAFGVLDSSNSISMLSNITSSDHFIDKLFGFQATKVFKKAQQDIAYLMAMKIAEHFYKNDRYFVPLQQKGVPNVNIKQIIGNGIKKRLMSNENQDLGDIDAVVVDLVKRKIFLMEIKFFKPAVNQREMLLKDKKIYEDINKILARAEWFEKNILDVKMAWGLEHSNYEVETILITGRPNYYGEKIGKEFRKVKHLTFDGILRKATL
ncbi:zinc ribbon domain-containing protein [Bacillus salacetis]|uniref:zinc ribbon domain-containing protein n=1 Tax=Bacillus salacetis TaxID=2315464 RepID=UPI003B9F9627